MIKSIDLATEPISAGELRILRVEAAAPIQLTIKCFVYKPPPERFASCPECGTFQIQSGAPFSIRASVDKFRVGGGAILVSIRDAEGDNEEIRLEVVNWDNPTSGGKRSGPLVYSPRGHSKGNDKDFVPSEKEEPALAKH